MLFRTNETAFVQTKRKLLEECDLWCIVSLPAGVFTAAGAGVKTNLLFFTKGTPTNRIWYYDLSDIKVGKKTPFTLSRFEELFRLLPSRADSERRWTVSIPERRQRANEESEPLRRQAKALEQDAARWRDRAAELRRLEPRDDTGIAEAEDKTASLTKEARELSARANAIQDAVYDLKAVNPHARSDEDQRTPEELLDLIEAKGREVAEALATFVAAFATSCPIGGRKVTRDPASAAEDLFELRKVADGVHIAVARPAYKVNSNTVIVELNDGLLVVDTHSKPSAARVIVALLRDLTSRPVRYVVNTHFHWDHWQGNEVYPATYPSVEVITNDITREAMVRKSLKRIQDHVRSVPAEITALRQELATATDPSRRAELQSNVRQAEAYLAEIQALKPALPTMAFECTMRIFKGDREIHLLHLGRAHTEGDVFVYLPKEKLVVTGDCVIGWTPFMGDGYPEDWGRTLGRLAELDFTTMLMGHAAPEGRDWLRVFRGYVEDLVEAVRREAAAGASLDDVKKRVPDQLAPKYEAPFSKYASYRPWRTGVLANIERAYTHVS